MVRSMQSGQKNQTLCEHRLGVYRLKRWPCLISSRFAFIEVPKVYENHFGGWPVVNTVAARNLA